MAHLAKIMSARQAKTPTIAKGFTSDDYETQIIAQHCRCGNCFACQYARFAYRIQRLTEYKPINP